MNLTQNFSKSLNTLRFKNKIKTEIFKKILKNNLNATNEKILIIGDKGYEKNIISPILTKAYTIAAEELGLNYEAIYQNCKGHRDIADEILIKKMAKLPQGSIIIMNMSNKIGSLEELGPSFRKFTKKNNHRFISAGSLGSIGTQHLKTMLDCLNIDYQKVAKQTEELQNKLTNATEIHVSTKAGTDIVYNVEGIQAKKATGIYTKPGEGGNLPGSETYIAPNKTKVDGTIVIDGSMRSREGTRIVKSPILLEIKKGMIVKMNNTFESKILKKTLTWAHNNSKNPESVWRIGELGIGMNKNAKIIGSTIIDEKTYGTCHFAIGSNYWFGGDIKSIIHLDQVIKNPIIKVDGKLLKY